LEQEARKSHRWGLVIAVLTVLVPLLCVGACAMHDEILASNFASVAVGMQRNEVVGVLGTPRYTQACTLPGPFRPSERQDCAETYVYPSWVQPFVPSVWVVWFDGKGIAIEKYHFVSW
jgi:hypothetical protein